MSILWSISKNKMLKDCPKLYYYCYHKSYNGWENNSNNLNAKIVYELKQLTSLNFEFYLSACNNIINFIKTGNKNIKEKVQENLHDICLKYADFEKWRSNPKYNKLLLEKLYYGTYQNDIVQEEIKDIKNKINTLDNVYTCKTIKEIENIKLTKSSMPDNEITLSSFINQVQNIDEDIQIFAKIDVVYKKDNNLIGVLFKFNSQDDFENEAQIYAQFLHNKYNYDYKNIIIRYEIITENKCLEKTDFTNNDIIEQSIEKIKQYEKNGKQQNENYFERNVNKQCELCKFRHLCKDYL